MLIDAGIFSPYGYHENSDVYGGCGLGIQTAAAALLISLAACDSSDQIFATVAGGPVSAAITQSISTNPQPGYRVSGNAVTGYVVTGNGDSGGGSGRTGEIHHICGRTEDVCLKGEKTMPIGHLDTSEVITGVTAQEVAANARASIGTQWASDGCTAFVWGVTNLAGACFLTIET